MPYIGRGPAKSGAFRILDDISTGGSGFNGARTSFALTVGSAALTVGLPETLLIAVDGVIQEAGSAYTISGSNIVFTAAPQADATFWGVELGDVGGLADRAVTQSASDDSTKVATTAYVDNQIDVQLTAEDLDVTSDSGTIAIDLDSETLTIAGGEGIDTSGASNTITIAGEDATTSNKGIASFHSDNFAVGSGVVTIKNGGVSIAEINTSSGTAGNTTFLRGDGTWQTAGAALTPWTENIDADTFTLTDVGATGNTWNSTALTVQSTTNAKLRLVIGSGDASIVFEGPTNWVLGLDNSESDQFVIGNDTALGADDSLRITTAGAVTMPNQPSVGCYGTSGQTNVTGNNTIYIMKWTPIWGSSFMTGTGNITFTAPVDGKYAVSATVEYEPSSTNANLGDLSIITSNRGWHSYTDPNGAAQVAKSISVVADMDANDTCQIKLQVGGVGADNSDLNVGSATSPRCHLTIHMVG